MNRDHSFAPEKSISLKDLIERSKIVSVLMLVLIFAASVAVLTIPEDQGLTGLNHLQVGQDAPKTLFAEIPFTCIDFKKLNSEQETTRQTFPHYYRRNDEQNKKITEKFNRLSDAIQLKVEAQSNGKAFEVPNDLPESDKNVFLIVRDMAPRLFEHLKGVFVNQIPREGFFRYLNDMLCEGIFTQSQWSDLPPRTSILIIDSNDREFGPRPVTEVLNPDTAKQKICEQFLRYYNGREKVSAEEYLMNRLEGFFAEGNLIPDKNLAEQRLLKKLEQLSNEAQKKTIQIQKRDVLFRHGETLTKEDIELFHTYRAALQEQKDKMTSVRILTDRIALTLIFMFFSCIYLMHIHPEVTKNNRSIWLLGSIAIIALISNRICGEFFRTFSLLDKTPPQYLFLILPLGFSALTISSIYGLRSAIFVGLYVTCIAALALDNSFQTMATGLLVSGIAGFAVRHTTDYKKFFMYGALSCFCTTFLTSIVFQLGDFHFSNAMAIEKSGETIMNLFTISLSGATLTAVFALVTLFILESFFDISTRMSYLTYTDRNHPLLKRLLLEAPGTYYHSERVASLAEKAASEIGENPLRIQACALFHDVGKLSNPAMFTENSTGVDVMGNLPPEKCAAIIKRHVEYGVELAKKYKLKTPIREAIISHHGSDFISFFYDKAKQNGESVKEEDFRYAGPRPQNKTVAILMLADCSEAISRSIKNPSPEELAEKIHGLFIKKIENGQLDDANLTMKDLSILQKAFTDSLVTMGHVRIAYPVFSKTEDDNA